MAGVAANLRAHLAETCEVEGYDRMTRREQLPVAAALSLLARERMSGEHAPEAAARVLDLWRDTLGAVGGSRTRRDGAGADQPGGVRPRRAQAAGRPRSGRGGGGCRARAGRRERGRRPTSPARRTPTRKAKATAAATPRACSARSPRRWRARPPPRTTSEGAEDEAAAAEGEDRPSGPQPRRDKPAGDGEAGYRAFTRAFDEEIAAEDLCDADELTRLRQQLDQQLQHLQGVVAKLANRLQRRLLAQQTARLGFRPRGRAAGCRPAGPRGGQPDAGAVLQARARHRFPRHRGDAADRQFRLDARPADHGGRHVRRHPGAHAGTLRGEGGGARLHHARLEGRAVARTLGGRRQAAQPRPAERPAPHHLQGRRRALAARPEESRPDAARGAAQGKHRRRGAAVGVSPPAGAAGAPAHPDGDQRRRAGR